MMNKKNWLWIICGSLFPPLFIFPITYFLIYRPLKDGVVGGSHLRFYFWGSFISSFTLIPNLPIKNLTTAFSLLNDPSNAQLYIISSFVFGFLGILILFMSLRNEPERQLILPIEKFKPDKLFFICFLLSLFPLIFLLAGQRLTLDEISHPFAFAIGVVFKNKSYYSVVIGFITISILTAIIEESFFRGILLRDYFKLGNLGRKTLLLGTALYFAICHLPIAFVSPLIFALFVNRIRLAYNNLLPSIILHFLWNANLTIVLLFSLNLNAPEIVKRSLAEELVIIQQVWTSKDVDLAKEKFPKFQKSSSGMYTLKGQYSTMFLVPDLSKTNKLTSIEVVFVKPIHEKVITYVFEEDDWVTSIQNRQDPKSNTPKTQELKCSKKIDICFVPNILGIQLIHLGKYDTSEVL